MKTLIVNFSSVDFTSQLLRKTIDLPPGLYLLAFSITVNPVVPGSGDVAGTLNSNFNRTITSPFAGVTLPADGVDTTNLSLGIYTYPSVVAVSGPAEVVFDYSSTPYSGTFSGSLAIFYSELSSGD